MFTTTEAMSYQISKEAETPRLLINVLIDYGQLIVKSYVMFCDSTDFGGIL